MFLPKTPFLLFAGLATFIHPFVSAASCNGVIGLVASAVSGLPQAQSFCSSKFPVPAATVTATAAASTVSQTVTVTITTAGSPSTVSVTITASTPATATAPAVTATDPATTVRTYFSLNSSRS